MNELHSDWAVSWGSILAGSVVIAAVTLILLAFGVGVGFSVVSPWADQGVSASTAGVGAGLFLIVVAMLASTMGGYVTGRLRHAWGDVHTHERFFRDTAHGVVAWGLAVIVSATLLAGAGTHILAGASAGSIPAAGAGAAQAGTTSGGPGDGYVDTLLRTDAAPATGAAQAQQGNPNATRGELTRIIAPAMRKGGDVSPADRTYAAKIVAARTGLSQGDAEQRVNQTITQAKQAADTARKTAAKISLWLAASLLAGALSAGLAAAEGGKLRNNRWYDEYPATVTPARATVRS